MDVSPLRPLTHLELLGLVRELQAAAAVQDAVRLTGTAQRLRDQLERHVDAEQREHSLLPKGVSQALRSGQERLLSAVAKLQDEACHDSPKPCLVRVAELAALLRHQAHLEQRASRLLWGRGGRVPSMR